MKRVLFLAMGLVLVVLLAGSLPACKNDEQPSDQELALARVMALNTDRAPCPWPEPGLSTGQRVGYWARCFLDQGSSAYCFGLADEGYVKRGLLVADGAMDCVSFVYRCTELARAGSDSAALWQALQTRFAGADLALLVDAAGRVDYDSPRHLDFSVDMVRSGLWGRDITGTLTGAVQDEETTLRSAPLNPQEQAAAGVFTYVPSGALQPGQLQEGDIAWLVLNPEHPGARTLRKEYGLVIGHLGVIVRRGEDALLVHAAASPLPGAYEKSGVVSVPLAEYLRRVDKFAGVMVTRLP